MAHDKEAAPRERLDEATYAKVKRLLLQLEAELRAARVHNLADDYGLLGFKLETRRHEGHLSATCRKLVFGSKSDSRIWGALHHGDEQRSFFRRGVLSLCGLWRDFPTTIGFAPDVANQIRTLSHGGERLNQAELAFIAALKSDDVATLWGALESIRRQWTTGPSEEYVEFDDLELDLVEIEDATPPPIRVNAEQQASGYAIHDYGHGSGVWSPAVNLALVDAGETWAPQVETRSIPFQALDRTPGWRRLRDAHRAKKVARNDAKRGLRSDLHLTDGSLPARVVLQPCDYVDNLATNDMARSQLAKRVFERDGTSSMEEQWDGWALFCEADGTLKSYADSCCSNQLGVSTLALTDDHYPLLIQQLGGNIHSANKIAPSGSGSLDDPTDFETLGQDTFGAWLRIAAQRELREELGLVDQRVAIRTMTIGFGGLGYRGGKPDIFFLGRVHCTLADLLRRSRHRGDEASLSSILRDVKTGSIGTFSANCLKRFCDGQLETQARRTSIPMLMIYEMVSHLCSERPRAIEGFLQGSDS